MAEIITTLINNFKENIILNDWELIITAIMIIICPTTWNLIARWEFHTKIFSKMAGDNRLAADIFAHLLIEMGILRNYLFSRTVRHQPHFEFDETIELILLLIGWTMIIFGVVMNILVLYRLGIHGIYYADYFGVLMEEMVTAFPYNIMNNPLYIGSTAIFLGTSFIYRSPSGILLTILAWGMYKFAGFLENPLTVLIYSEENIREVRLMNERRNSLGKNKNKLS